jgi:ATP-dependent exoDNAse (exonuclease V) beta subunit
MRQPSLLIIKASAGTGKTYRLAIEYVRILLDLYGREDFSMDNILVLTFTRKATSEIRERIVQHLELLCSEDPEKEKERGDLLDALRKAGQSGSFALLDKNRILSALIEISGDRKKLQVMTIDAYIGSIFRNIVRPLCSIDRYDIDQQAIEKRMPHLLDHLMKMKLQTSLSRLLRRRVSPSLDEYRRFFTDLINNRWLYHQTGPHPKEDKENKEQQNSLKMSREDGLAALEQAKKGFEDLLVLLRQNSPEEPPETLFNKAFRESFTHSLDDWQSLRQAIWQKLSDPFECHDLFKVFTKNDNVYNGQKFRKKILQEAKSKASSLQEEIIHHLADYLIHALFLPEQEDILDIWSTILAEYDKLIHTYKNLTYNDVAWMTLENLFKVPGGQFDLKEPDVANEFYLFLSHRSRFILIDEFQDTSLMQFSILKPIIEEVIAGAGSREFGGLTVVGDEKQSIFGWRGGERELLLKLPKLLPALKEAKFEHLDYSYRSSIPMMDFINGIFSDPELHDWLRNRGLEWGYEPCISVVNNPANDTQIEFCTDKFSSRGKGKSIEEVMRGFVRNSILPAIDQDPGQEIAVLCRRGKELNLMQQLLEETGESGIYQPSSTLLEHAWVTPLIAWLKWLAFRNWLDLLEVLRSNYVLLKARPFKKIVDEIALAEKEERLPDLGEVPIAARIISLADEEIESISKACQAFLDALLPSKEPSERDIKNIHAFLSLARDFELDDSERDKSIPAFLDYLDANREQEFLKQATIEGYEAPQLLTIHKSKGLQFDRVFVFYNLSGKAGNDFNNLKWFIDYAPEDFQVLNGYALTHHYESVLKHSSFKKLYEKTENREILEELNNLYVAFTRARTGLHICLAYEGKDEFGKYLQERIPNKANPQMALAAAIQKFFVGKGIAADDLGRFSFSVEHQKKGPEEDKVPRIKSIDPEQLAATLPTLAQEPFAELEPNETDPDKDWKKIWLEEQKNLIGDLAHHYLNFIKFNLPDEHEYAQKQCLARFGSILTQGEIQAKLDALRAQLPEEKMFPAGYDKVYTEITLYLGKKTLRLDRLMLNTREKTALIQDFKTGGISDETQLEVYKAALRKLDFITRENYEVKTEYISIDLD